MMNTQPDNINLNTSPVQPIQNVVALPSIESPQNIIDVSPDNKAGTESEFEGSDLQAVPQPQ